MGIGNISLSLYKIPVFLESNLHKEEMWDFQERSSSIYRPRNLVHSICRKVTLLIQN